jgi:hypothetical protein
MAEKRMQTVKRSQQFAIAVGLTTEEELLTAKKSNRKIAIDYNLAMGRMFCGQVSESVYDGKPQRKLGYDIWPVGSSKAQGIPLNQNELRKAGDAAGAPFETSPSAAAGQGSQTPPKSPWG